ncbi:hypothetical protein DYB25_009506 [Aphanomyces astaci]|uniref:Uncharacterized protein n=1 Tax=Aphanomyces astaci TaxID=112090 RepID=A0A397AH89_APHAT|nr:hypothetical protein DYB25_009506 [Aphanomyces astaci]
MADCREVLYRSLEASIERCGGRLDEVKVLETAHEAHATFPSLPASQTMTIVHTTLARLMSPSISADSLVTVQDKCRVVTARLRREAFTVLLSSLWYVEETHYFSAGSGPRTSIPLPPPVLHVPEA